MRTPLLLLPLSMLFANSVLNASSTDVWVTQSGAGNQNGTSLTNAAPVGFLSNPANCGAGATQVGPGTTIHLNGTFMFAAGSAGIRFDQMGCSGANGNPITIKFETGAVLQAPYFFNGGGSPAGGGLNIHNLRYIVVDGGVPCGTTQGGVDSATPCNGTIKNTANGTAYPNQVHSRLLEANNCTPGCEIKNIHLGPNYVRLPDWNLSSSLGTTTCGASSCTVTCGASCTVGTGAVLYIKGNSIIANGAYRVTGNPTSTTFTISGGPGGGTGQGGTACDESPNSNGQDLSQFDAITGTADGIKFHDSVAHDGGWLVNLQGASVQVYNNQIYNMDHGISMTPLSQGQAGPVIHDNHIRDMANWDDTVNGLNNNHHDGIHFLIDTVHNPQDYYSNYLVYNNQLDGDPGTPNAWLFLRASSSGGAIFNNVLGCTPARHFNTFSIEDNTFAGSFTTNILVANNTVTCTGAYTGGGSAITFNGTNVATITGTVFKNNIIQGQQIQVYLQSPFGANYFASGGIDYNLYQKVQVDSAFQIGVWPFSSSGKYAACINDSTCDSGQTSSPGNVCWGQSSGTFCKTAILPPGSGQDAHSSIFTSAGLKLNANGSVQPGSPAIDGGANLSGLCSGPLVPLCSDIAGYARPATGPWNIGAYQSLGLLSPPTNLRIIR